MLRRIFNVGEEHDLADLRRIQQGIDSLYQKASQYWSGIVSGQGTQDSDGTDAARMPELKKLIAPLVVYHKVW